MPDPVNAVEKRRLALAPGVIEAKFEALQGFLSAGVSIIAGNDAGLPYTNFGDLWQELDALMAGGMNAMAAIDAATLTAARTLGLADRIGSIRPGKQADLLVVDGDPLTHIAALADVRLVMQAGRIAFKKADGCEQPDRQNSVSAARQRAM